METPDRILIIEDETKVARFIKKGLEENEIQAEIVSDGISGKNIALSENFDLVILDLNLPGMNGQTVCKEIKAIKPRLPILMLTALSTTEDKIVGFDNGTNDYMVKPFEFRELLARVRAQLKHSKQHLNHTAVLQIADLVLNTEHKSVVRAGKNIELTAKEFALLELFMRNEGKVFSRAEIAEKIWEINFDSGTNVIDVYINFLRKKMDKDFTKKLIHTHIGMGYAMKNAEA